MANKLTSDNLSKFKIGDVVHVKQGSKDPDYGMEISGWVGEIEDISFSDDAKWLYCILWNEKTLKKMDRKLIKRCDKDNLDHMRMYLEEHDLEIVG